MTTKLFGREQELVSKLSKWTIVRPLREDQPLKIVKLITRTALYSVSKQTVHLN